jgi:hypothetical protein
MIQEDDDSWPPRTWNYFGLMHVCPQIRAEYRPLWLRTLSCFTSFDRLGDFIPTFFPNPDDMKYAPTCVEIQ